MQAFLDINPKTNELPEFVGSVDTQVFTNRELARDYSFSLKRNTPEMRTRILPRSLPVLGSRLKVWVVVSFFPKKG